MTTKRGTSASTLWILLLTGASTASTLALGCATPFAALAALAAVHMRRKDGTALVIAAWLASQIVGFGLLGYPHDAQTLGWGATLVVAAVTAALGAGVAGGLASYASRLATAYALAFVAFKGIILLASLGLGGTETLAAPALLAKQFLRDGAFLLGLLAFYHALVALGLPRAMARPAPRAVVTA